MVTGRLDYSMNQLEKQHPGNIKQLDANKLAPIINPENILEICLHVNRRVDYPTGQQVHTVAA